MLSKEDLRALLDAGGAVVTADGHTVGRVGDVYLDNRTEEPSWVSVRVGRLGTGEVFVPLAGATTSDGELHVPFASATVLSAPHVQPRAVLSPADERMLYEHFWPSGASAAPGSSASTAVGEASDGNVDAGAGESARRPGAPVGASAER